MPIDAILRRCLKRLAREPGPFEALSIAEPSRDGSAVFIGAVVPLPAKPTEATAGAGASPPIGRRAEVPLALLRWLQGRPEARYSDIIDAMADLGHSRTQADAVLGQLVRFGLIAHPTKGGAYSAAIPGPESTRSGT